MATVADSGALPGAAPKAKRSRFFANSAIAMAVAVVLSFAPSYFLPLAAGTKFILLRHLHGLTFFGFMALYVWQANLVAAGKVKLHRELGLAGVALGGMMLVLGLWMAVTEIGEQLAKGKPLAYEFATYNLFDISLFALFLAAAIHQAPRNIERHRRLIYVAAICLLGPAISRWLPYVPLPYPWADASPNLAADLFLLPLAIHDRRTLGRVHPVTWGAALVLVPWNLVEPLVARSVWWNESFAPHLYGFA